MAAANCLMSFWLLAKGSYRVDDDDDDLGLVQNDKEPCDTMFRGVVKDEADVVSIIMSNVSSGLAAEEEEDEKILGALRTRGAVGGGILSWSVLSLFNEGSFVACCNDVGSSALPTGWSSDLTVVVLLFPPATLSSSANTYQCFPDKPRFMGEIETRLPHRISPVIMSLLSCSCVMRIKSGDASSTLLLAAGVLGKGDMRV